MQNLKTFNQFLLERTETLDEGLMSSVGNLIKNISKKVFSKIEEIIKFTKKLLENPKTTLFVSFKTYELLTKFAPYFEKVSNQKDQLKKNYDYLMSHEEKLKSIYQAHQIKIPESLTNNNKILSFLLAFVLVAANKNIIEESVTETLSKFLDSKMVYLLIALLSSFSLIVMVDLMLNTSKNNIVIEKGYSAFSKGLTEHLKDVYVRDENRLEKSLKNRSIKKPEYNKLHDDMISPSGLEDKETNLNDIAEHFNNCNVMFIEKIPVKLGNGRQVFKEQIISINGRQVFEWVYTSDDMKKLEGDIMVDSIKDILMNQGADVEKVKKLDAHALLEFCSIRPYVST